VVCRASESLRTILASGEVRVLAVSDLPEHERGFLARQDIESVLVAPVVAGDEAWGALAFGERKSSRDWSPPETGALETAARVLGAVVYRERVALALRQSERRNRAILTAIPDIMFRLGRNGVIIGHKAIQIGEKEIAADALDGQSVRRHFLNALPDIEAKVSNVLETGIPFLAEQVQLSIDPGRLYELRIVRTGDQESLAIARDITDRHRSEQRTRALNSATNVLTEAETVSEMIVSMLDVLGSNLGFDTAAYWVVDTDRGALRLAEMWHRDLAATRTFEAAARDLSIFPGNGVAGRVWATRGSTWIEDVRVEGGFLMVASAELSNLETAFAFAVTAGGTVHGVIELLSGARRMPDPNLVKAAESLGSQIGLFIGRKQHESQIIASEARFRTMADTAPMFMWLSGIAGNCSFANRPWLDFTGTTLPETIESGWLKCIHPDDRPRTILAFEAAADDRQGFRVEHRVRRHDGEYRWVLNTGAPRFGANGEFVGYSGSGIDITDKIRVEAELRLEKQFVVTMLDTIDVGIVACDAEGELTLLNRATRELLGISSSVATQGDWTKAARLYQPNSTDSMSREQYPLMRALRGEVIRSMEVTSIADPENPKVLLVSGQRIVGPDAETTGAVVAFRDVTSERLLEGQFRQAHRMEAVGRLAGGIAHDFNNHLTVITGYGEMLRQRLGGSQELLQFTGEILDASTRAASLTRQLLAFSRKQLLQPRAVELNALVRNLHKMLERLIGEDVELRIKLDPSIGTILADPGQIEQVVINLVVNARDAMPGGGILVIETSTVELDQTAVEPFSELQPGMFHMVTVSDTGCGMSPEIMSHIYEPFFTTKGADRGTGLGLATVYGIVRQSSGAIFAVSDPGIGSTFKICFPVHAASDATAGNTAGAVLPPSRGETILVAEDDRAVRTLVSCALVAEGYRVLEARNGEETLALCDEHKGAIDLVLSDMVMPKMSGREMARILSASRPDMRILFMSGYTHEILSAEERSSPEVFILEKPFDRIALGRAVRDALDSETGSSTPESGLIF
jgi:PAS domain S-box-containing protein